jgi:[protein-PII] uridylyltransferase
MNGTLFFDERTFQKKLETEKPITVFRDAIAAINTQFDNRFHEGENIRNLVNDRAGFIDRLLHYAWYLYTWSDSISLIAVGGYGRYELHPHSDIDLLILCDRALGESDQKSVEHFITFLWDLQLHVGHSVRSMQECIDVAREDITIATNLLESRTLEGNLYLRTELKKQLDEQKVWPSHEFFRAKWDEQIARHAKHNNTEYNLEPNLKNAPGGLRDIQTIVWVAKKYFGVTEVRELVDREEFLLESEYNILRRGEEELWRIRYGLHILTGRGEDRLLFEYQRALATEFGFIDNEKNLAVEQFMKRYYRAVIALRELNDMLLHYLDEKIFRADRPKTIIPINARFQICNDYIEVTHPDVFRETPSALLEIFVLMGKDTAIKGVRASTIRLLREARVLIDEDFKHDRKNTDLFIQFMQSPYQLAIHLRHMRRYGILGRYLREFGEITGQMQHDLFHIYTVDAHTLLVISNLRRFRHQEAEKNFPIAAHIVRRLPKPELLYIAGMFHDIAKGRGGDHSQLGAIDAQNFCERHHMSRWDTNLVVWLVRNHLLMSSIAQRLDISDPGVIHDFALKMGDQLHLDSLYTLTVADVNATNPTLWSAWKASLMRQLYLETKLALRRGLENPVDKQDWIEDTQNAVLRRLVAKGYTETQIRTLWDGYREDYFLRESPADIVWHMQAILKHNAEDGDPTTENTAPLILIRNPKTRFVEGATQIFIRTPEKPNLFAAIVTTLDHLNLNIQDAKLYSAGKGIANYTFYVLNEDLQPITRDAERRSQIRRALRTELSQLDAADYPSIIQRRTPRQLQYFSMPTRTSLNNDIKSGTTVLEVISPDRPGLLARIALVFLRFNIRLRNAKIATLGERVEDAFSITDADGNPLTDPALCDALQKAICEQLDKKPEQPKAISF